MIRKLLLATAGCALLASPALAASGKTVAGPAQPIPYEKMDASLKASPSQRASTDWWAGQQVAQTTPAAAPAAATDTATTGPVNPPTDATSQNGNMTAPQAGTPTPETPAADPSATDGATTEGSTTDATEPPATEAPATTE